MKVEAELINYLNKLKADKSISTHELLLLLLFKEALGVFEGSIYSVDILYSLELCCSLAMHCLMFPPCCPFKKVTSIFGEEGENG